MPNWLQRLLGKAPPPASATGSVAGIQMLNFAEAKPLIDGTKFAAAYIGNPWVYACVNAIADDVATLPLKLLAADGKTPVEKHPALVLLDYVNSEMDQARLFTETSAWLDLNGNAYWLLDRPKDPVSIRPLPADKCRWGKSGKLEFRPKGTDDGMETYDRELVIQFKAWSPVSTIYGQSTIQAAAGSINLDDFIRQMQQAFTQRGGVPGQVLYIQGGNELDDDQQRRFRAQWDAVYGGAKNAGKVMMLNASLMKLESIQISTKDAMFVELAEQAVTEILAAIGVPPVRVGLLKHASYANANQQMRQYWDSTIRPRADGICNTLNEFLLPMFGARGMKFAFDYSEVADLQEDQNLRATRLVAATGGPFLTVNEARELDGKEPLGPEGNVVYRNAQANSPLGEKPPPPPQFLPGVPRPLGEMPNGDATMPQDETPAQGAGKDLPRARVLAMSVTDQPPQHSHAKGRYDFGTPEHEAITKGFLDSVEPFVEECRAAAARVQLKALHEVIGNLRESQSGGKALLKETEPSIDAVLFDLTAAGKVYVQAILPLTEGALEAGAGRVLAMVEVGGAGGGAWDVMAPEVIDYLRDKKFQITTLPKTLHEDIRAALIDVRTNGGTTADMIARLQEMEPGLDGYSAERIAWTEMGEANNAGGHEAMRQNGIEREEWVTAGDERVRDSHADANGQTVGIDEAFSVGDSQLLFPGDGSLGADAGEVINCRCTTVPVVD